MTFDCRRCGACCTNPDENRSEGSEDWVEVEPGDELLRRRTAARLVVYNDAGVPHLRLHGTRCAALRGTLGRQVSCAIYALRPRACRRLEAGSPRCLQYRRERGVEDFPVARR
jgi:Fe-S-cluster containining protein